ncbi:MAG: MFS transporter [Muribaculaceae bacterium]|nr:MFS transporter [Muribaculaceae bacterium]
MIKTGKVPLPVLTYIAILSVCFIINLPGVAVAPVEGKMKELLHTSELEIQLLTILPNFVIIPFVLFAGKLSDYKHKIPLILFALILFLGCGVAYMFSKSMTGLIIISCLLGVADGILIPFAMGFIVNSFEGKYRTRNLGIKSATSNFGTVVASFIVGFLIQGGNWHLPFLVYLIAIVPLVLCYWLKYIPGFGTVPISPDKHQKALGVSNEKGIEYGKIWGLIGNNVFFTFITFTLVIYLPQLLQNYGWNPKISGEITAFFFIFVLLAGFILEKFIKTFRSFVFPLLGLFLIIGLAFFVFIKAEWAMYCGSVLVGVAFGIFQPLIYDKTSYAVTDPKKNIFGLSLVLTALYIGIAIEPFIITAIKDIFLIKDENHFAFSLGFCLAIVYLILSFFCRRRFTFSIEPSYYS